MNPRQTTLATVIAAATLPVFQAEADPPPLSETHIIPVARMITPQSGASATFEREIPLFDTMGGMRELVGMHVYFGAEMLFDMTFAPNPSGVVVGSRHEIYRTWMPTFANGFDLAFFDSLYATDAAVPPGFDGIFEEDVHVYNRADIFPDNPADFALFIGTGVTHVTYEMTIDMSVRPSVAFPQSFFDPDLISVTMHEYWLDMSFTYLYQPVPAPGTAACFALPALCLLWRRR